MSSFNVETSTYFPGKVILHHDTRQMWDRDTYLEPEEALRLAADLAETAVKIINERAT